MESYAILSWIKYLWENIGLERCSKKGIYACLVKLTEVENVEEYAVALQLLDLPKHKQHRKGTINTHGCNRCNAHS